jgi:hypothetical protein
MKVTEDILNTLTKTLSEPSQCAEGIWLARSAIGINDNGIPMHIFGFGAAKDRLESEIKSKYELLEHLAFLPHLYNTDSAIEKVIYSPDSVSPQWQHDAIQDFFIGKPSPVGIFSANGCAISRTLQESIRHAKRELLERHLCCEIWYKRCRSIKLVEIEIGLNFNSKAIQLDFYTTNGLGDEAFVIAALECAETGFYAFGAAVKATFLQAGLHASCEALMLLEDAIKGRTGMSTTKNSQRNILSLRDISINSERKKYLEYLLKQSAIDGGTKINYQNISFQPLPNLYASRSFANNALDPRQFESYDNVPTLPLF